MLVPAAEPELLIDADDLAATSDEARADRMRQQRGAVPPGAVSVGYYEPARDYQTGLQRARRPDGGRIVEAIELPASLGAEGAKAIAEANLARSWAERVERTVTLPWRHLTLAPGTHVALPGSGAVWRVAHWAFERMTVALTLLRVPDLVTELGLAEPGRPVTPPDVPHGATTLHLLDLPELGETAATSPRLLIAAAGASPGWRRAALSMSVDAQASWTAIGQTAPRAAMGIVTATPGIGSALLFDTINEIEVLLLNDGMTLEDAEDTRLLAGANLAVAGEELIQFGRAVPLGGGAYRLGRLLRGRRGTEFAIEGHAAGERFVLLTPETLKAFDPPLASLGSDAVAMAVGVGDADPVLTEAAAIGAAVRPPSPVNFAAEPDGAGGFALSWTRRSRAGWHWLDWTDAPLAEESETYRLEMLRDGIAVRSVTLGAPGYGYAAGDFAADLGGADGIVLSLTQIGTFAPSRPARLTISG